MGDTINPGDGLFSSPVSVRATLAFSFVTVALLRSLAEGFAAGGGDDMDGSDFNPLRPCFRLFGLGDDRLQVTRKECAQWYNNVGLQFFLLVVLRSVFTARFREYTAARWFLIILFFVELTTRVLLLWLFWSLFKKDLLWSSE